MRASGISAFTKNVPLLPRRSALTVGAATLVLGAGLPLLPGAGTAWACGAPLDAPMTAPTAAPTPAVTHDGTVETGFFMLGKDPLTITAGGGKLEIPVEVGNFTGAAYEKVVPHLSLYNEKAGSHPGGGTNLRVQDLSVEVNTGAGWKKVPVVHGCDPVLYADTANLPGVHLDNGRATHFTFRVALSADSSKDQTEIQVGVSAGTEDSDNENTPKPKTAFRYVQVKHPAAPKPTTPAKAAAAPAKPQAAAAEPAAASTAPTATVAPTATAVPTTAAALAKTGASSPNGFLAGSAAAFVALGAGVLIAVRRLRNQG
ncbi:hypothetical protein GCM10010495_09760 [Kitasatospora herbaricolor]|uniref:hypothetical protein n=1 Tax=Kitasatospora herbaricolor TaxID=68217 RepID=UPI00174C7F0E|nr:hypothetical protein [Kitasatospora herbaricolor]MDQ0309588.1 hypothetical protein [Kitasatospora herbaricolor]GGV00855.1 hypothetical protein GCM10010495_09760 [Kitasatospora herbaricolor]